MTQDMLSQDEIDALLRGVNGESEANSPCLQSGDARTKPYNPATQHRVIRERLHALDIINERFARSFRVGLRTLLRRNPDISVGGIRFQSASTFTRHMPVPSNLNLVSMKPLRGTGLVVFPPALVYMVIENLFGGDGKNLTKSDGKDFTYTEQRIIRLILNQAMECYQSAWQSVYPIEIEFQRSEMQARFANVTSSPSEIVVNTTFNLEVGNISSEFFIALPYLMIEPIKGLLNGPLTDHNAEDERLWNKRMSGEIKDTSVTLKTDFVKIKTDLGSLIKLKVGDILNIELPETVTARVDGIPVMECEYGEKEGIKAIKVRNLYDHTALQGFGLDHKYTTNQKIKKNS